MKECQSIATPALQFRKMQTIEAQEDWQVVSVVPDEDISIHQGLKLADICNHHGARQALIRSHGRY
jgi:hypothetical protein